jgi:hypothetical protein
VAFWWDEIIAPLTHTERPKLIQWIISIPWYYRVFAGMFFVIIFIGEAAFQFIKKQDDAIETLTAKVGKLEVEEEIQSQLGDLLNEGSELRIEELPSEAHFEAWLHRFDRWRQDVLDALGNFGLAADYSLFQNADAMDDRLSAFPDKWEAQVQVYDRMLKNHMHALATFRRKNTFSEAALVRCGRNGVVFAVQFRLLSSIKRDREVGHSGSL